MFTSKQIIPATTLLKNFTEITKSLSEAPQALLITQKSRGPLVLVDAQIFEGLLAQYQMYPPRHLGEGDVSPSDEWN